jgi:YD repeat-containing protein
MLPRREPQISQERHSNLSRTPASFLATALSFPLTGTVLFTFVLCLFIERATPAIEACESPMVSHELAGNHIRELIPERFQKRYQKWKKEYLSTEAGREQWERYARHRNFTLTITISAEKGRGAETDQYRWDESGQLIAATITLGAELDEGYPNPVNYPVTSSLAHTESSTYIRGSILAAAKLAHEFGHVNRTANTDAQLFRLQNRLIPLYNHILLTNGRNIHDPQLVELAQQMRGTPVQIGRDRELWAEANALVYLREKCPEDGAYGRIVKAIQRAIEEYAKEHIERFH